MLRCRNVVGTKHKLRRKISVSACIFGAYSSSFGCNQHQNGSFELLDSRGLVKPMITMNSFKIDAYLVYIYMELSQGCSFDVSSPLLAWQSLLNVRRINHPMKTKRSHSSSFQQEESTYSTNNIPLSYPPVKPVKQRQHGRIARFVKRGAARLVTFEIV
jgi:hypothetical protein